MTTYTTMQMQRAEILMQNQIAPSYKFIKSKADIAGSLLIARSKSPLKQLVVMPMYF